MEQTVKETISIPKEAKNIRTCVVGEEVQVSYEIEVKMEAKEPQNQEIGPEEIKGTKEWLDKYFPVVHASTLSLDDEIFFEHGFKTKNQKFFRERLEKAIMSGLQDFRAPIMDPSFDEYGNICYKAGMMPAIGKSATWWKIKAKEFLPEKGSRLGLAEERIAFLALFVKELVKESRYTINDAWTAIEEWNLLCLKINHPGSLIDLRKYKPQLRYVSNFGENPEAIAAFKAVCDQSKDLGHYRDSKNPKYEFEPTGSRKVGRWYDLGNDRKITQNKAGDFLIYGGNFHDWSYDYPLSYRAIDADPDCDTDDRVGWTVLSV